jgi:hypothetical protein
MGLPPFSVDQNPALKRWAIVYMIEAPPPANTVACQRIQRASAPCFEAAFLAIRSLRIEASLELGCWNLVFH